MIKKQINWKNVLVENLGDLFYFKMPYSSFTYDLLPYDLLYFIILHLPVQQTHGYGVHHGHRHVGLGHYS